MLPRLPDYNVSLSSLKLVLERLADRQSNFVEEERAVALIISKVEEGTFAEFLTSVAGLFEECFHLRSSKKNKHLRAIELEKNLIHGGPNQIQPAKLGMRSFCAR